MPDSPQPQPTWQRLWQAIMGREALKRASGEQAPPPPPQNPDISVVQRAAEEAGKRMEQEKVARQQQMPKYGCGGVVKGYGNYGR